MRESKIEKAHKKEIENEGGRSYKWVSPGCTGVPDLIDLKPIPEKHRAIVAKYIQFNECKQKNKKPRIRQKRVINEIQSLGFKVGIIDEI